MLQPSYAKPTGLYAGSPLQEYKALNADVAQQYNQNLGDVNELNLLANNLKLRDQDVGIKQEVIDKLKSDFQTTASLGNYEDAKYKVAKAANDFQMNNKLKAALQNKAAEDSYVQDLGSRLKKWQEGDKKGGIDEKSYQYALINSKKLNDRPTEYDENTLQDKNQYSGVKVMNDLSGDIQDDIFKQFENFKSTQMFMPDGKTRYEYKVDPITKTEKVFKNGEEVTFQDLANSMKQYVENKEQYKAYLNQSRNINKWGNTYDPKTGTNREINLDDISFLPDDKKKEIYLGASDKDIQQLATSNKTSDKDLYNRLKEKEKSFNLNNPQVVNDVYDKFNKDNQLNEVVYPAAEKYSFDKMNYNIFTDQGAKLALEDWYQKAKEKRAETSLPPITETDNSSIYTGEDFATMQSRIPALKSNVDKYKLLLANPKTPPAMRETYQRELINAENEYNAEKTVVDSYYTNVPNSTREKIKKDLVTILGNSNLGDLPGGNQSIAKFRTYLDQELPNLLDEARSNQDWDAVRTLNYAISYRNRNGGKLDDNTINSVANVIASNPKDYVGKMQQVNEDYSLEKAVNSNIREHFNTEQLKEHSLRTFNVADLGIKDNNPLANQVIFTGRNILNNSQNLILPNGETLDKVVSGNSPTNKVWVLNDKGDDYIPARISTNDSYLSPNSSDISGRMSGTATFKDEKGRDLVISENKPEAGNPETARRASVKIYAPNSNAMELLAGEMSKAARSTGQTDIADKLDANVMFGSYNNKLRGGIDSPPITVNIGGKQLKVGLKKIDDTHSILVDPSGNPILPGDKGIFEGNKAAELLYNIYRANK